MSQPEVETKEPEAGLARLLLVFHIQDIGDRSRLNQRRRSIVQVVFPLFRRRRPRRYLQSRLQAGR